MPAAAPEILDEDRHGLLRLGAELRAARKRQKVSAVALAEAAGLSRVTLHRIETGEPSVAMGAWAAVAGALGLQLQWSGGTHAPDGAPPAGGIPDRVRLADYPQLRALAWQLGDDESLSPAEALALYERNWRHVDERTLTPEELDLIQALSRVLGGGRLLVRP